MCIYGFRILRGDSVLTLLLFVSLVYVASVWGRNYHDWLNLKQAVAINGRYLLPVLPFIFLLLGGSYQLFLRGRTKAKALLGSIAFLLFMQGGGITSFMYYSRDSWYWDGNTQIRTMNHAAKRVVSPFFITTYIKAIDHLYQ
jgi:Na+/H+ antiporter NhaD/arsenite permease-like protein